MVEALSQLAPDFKAIASNGEEVQLSDFRGQTVVLYFYPRDMTPTCTKQACTFRDFHVEFSKVNAVILGVSPDPIEKHQRFIHKHDLPFLLLSDEDHKISEAYGVWQLKKTFGKEYMGVVRSTFVIDEEGKIIKEWRNVRLKNHVEEVLAFLQSEND